MLRRALLLYGVRLLLRGARLVLLGTNLLEHTLLADRMTLLGLTGYTLLSGTNLLANRAGLLRLRGPCNGCALGLAHRKSLLRADRSDGA